MLKRRLMLCGVLGALWFVYLFCGGCGKKADPVPSKLILPPAISDLHAESVAAGIRLSWSVHGPIGSLADFRILRSEEAGDQACAGCPQEYRLLSTLKVTDEKFRHGQENKFHFMDETVAAGRSYSYRISACDSRGHCGEPSAPIQRLRKK